MSPYYDLQDQINALKKKMCCCEGDLDTTSLSPPVDAPSANGATILVNTTTGVIYYWDSNSWEIYTSSVGAHTHPSSDITDFTAAARTAAVADVITNGVTTIAPSENAVFDALALKSDTGHTHVAADVTDFTTAARTASVANTITNGVTTIAPSQDAVFDALALKSAIGHTHVMTDVTDLPILVSGTYSPALGAEVNLDSSPNPRDAQYMRLGSVVTVSGKLTGVDPTGTLTPTSIELSVPIASSFVDPYNACGTAFCGAITGMGASISSAGASTIIIEWIASDVTPQDWSYHYTYLII